MPGLAEKLLGPVRFLLDLIYPEGCLLCGQDFTPGYGHWPAPVFGEVLDRYFGGVADERTDALLGRGV